MQRLHLIPLLALLLIGMQAEAQVLELQQTTYTTYDMSTGATSTHPFKKFRFREKGESSYRRVGSNGNRLKPYFEGNQDALNELKKYKTKRTIATFSGIAAIGSFAIFAVENLSDTEVGDPGDEGPKSTGLLGVTVGLVIIDYIFAATSNKHIINAVQKHNEKEQSKLGLSIGLMEINAPQGQDYIWSSGIKLKF